MDVYRVFLLSSILAISGLLFNSAHAALPVTGIDIGQVSPANVTDSITKRLPEPLSKEKRLLLPSLTQELDLGEAKRYKFKLKKVVLFGNRVIPTSELMKTYKPYYGKTITLSKLLDLIKESTSKYREKGYILSQAYLPAQDIDKETGEVRIGVVEGYINSVNVVSDSIPYSTKLLLKQYGQRMMQERPITKKTLERYALLSDDLPGGSVKVVFSPARNQPGAANVEFVAQDNKVLGAEVFYNNRGTRLLGPRELSVTLHQYNGIYGNKSSINAVRTDNREMRLFLFNHRQPLNSDGLALSVIGNKTTTEPDYLALPALNRTALETPGDSKSIQAQLEYPLIRSRNYNLLIQAKLDASNNDTEFLGTTLFDERLRSFRAGFVFDWLDSWFADILAVSLVGVEISQGLNIFGARLEEPDETTRPNVDKDYTKLSGTISRTQPLGGGFFIRGIGAGQYSFDELVSSEEFGYGGRLIGLGYDPFQVAGEHGISGKAELGYGIPTGEIVSMVKESLDLDHNSIWNNLIMFNADIFGFYDGGRVWNKNHEDSAQKSHDSAVSAGFGIRGSILKYIYFEGMMAKPMTREAENEGDRQPRYFFSVGASYH